MKIKFSPGVAFDGFDGMERTCVVYGEVKNGVYRCRAYRKVGTRMPNGAVVTIHPKPCPPGMISRSPGLIHPSAIPCAPKAKKVAKRKARKSAKRSRRR